MRSVRQKSLTTNTLGSSQISVTVLIEESETMGPRLRLSPGRRLSVRATDGWGAAGKTLETEE